MMSVKLLLSLFVLSVSMLNEVATQQTSSINWACTVMLQSCELLQGIKGNKGEKGRSGPQGNPGRPGQSGQPGEPGDPEMYYPYFAKGAKGYRGSPGVKGQKGTRGTTTGLAAGESGVMGLPGRKGAKGLQGTLGAKGADGFKGDPIATVNWKQCTFPLDVNKQNGVINECFFRKNRNSSSLHVIYQGDTHVGLCGECCKKWHFQFDDRDCSIPGPIEAFYSGLKLVYNVKPNTLPVFFHGSISGYCSSVPKGVVRVSLMLSNCPQYPSDMIVVNTLVKVTGRFIIQEVQPPQQ